MRVRSFHFIFASESAALMLFVVVERSNMGGRRHIMCFVAQILSLMQRCGGLLKHANIGESELRLTGYSPLIVGLSTYTDP